MMKSLITRIMLCVALVAFGGTTTASAQGFLKKAQSAVSKAGKVVGDVAGATGEIAGNAADTIASKIKKEDIPVYHCEMFYITDDNGNRVKNEDGTDDYRVLLVNQKGQIVTAEAAAAQAKQVNQAILTIAGKVGLSAGIGALSGGGKGALVGVATGLGMSITDLMTIISLKKDINKHKKVPEAYKKSFDEEGKALNVKVDPTKIKDLGLDAKNAVTASAEKLKADILTDAPTNESIEALIGAVTTTDDGSKPEK